MKYKENKIASVTTKYFDIILFNNVKGNITVFDLNENKLKKILDNKMALVTTKCFDNIKGNLTVH